MKMLIVGSGGQVGSALLRAAETVRCEAIALRHGELDVTDEQMVDAFIERLQPTHVINAAAYNAVDRAEDEFGAAYATNAFGPAYLALAARRNGVVLVHYSSDYVFDGTKDSPYSEEDQPNPLSTYGRSKLLGEQSVAGICEKHYIIRTSWVFAPEGNNFVSRLLKQAEGGAALRFIDDQWVAPTYADDIARATFFLLEQKAPFGLYHAAGAQAYTPYAWAKAVLDRAGAKATLEPVASTEFSTKAVRPARSVLANTRLEALGMAMPSGMTRLDDYFSRNEVKG